MTFKDLLVGTDLYRLLNSHISIQSGQREDIGYLGNSKQSFSVAIPQRGVISLSSHIR